MYMALMTACAAKMKNIEDNITAFSSNVITLSQLFLITASLAMFSLTRGHKFSQIFILHNFFLKEIVFAVKFPHSPILLYNKSVFPMAMYCFGHCFLYSRTEYIMWYGAVRKFYQKKPEILIGFTCCAVLF